MTRNLKLFVKFNIFIEILASGISRLAESTIEHSSGHFKTCREYCIIQGSSQNLYSRGGGPSGSQGGQANCKNISMYIV